MNQQGGCLPEENGEHPPGITTGTFPQQEDALNYLKKHKISELFQNMTSQLIYHQPENARDFVKEYLEKLKTSRQVNLDIPCLFDESNVESVYRMVDPVETGHINSEKCKAALQTLGVSVPPSSEAGGGGDADTSSGGKKLTAGDTGKQDKEEDENIVTKDLFIKEAKLGLNQSWATYDSAMAAKARRMRGIPISKEK